MLIKYNPPAILANCAGDAPATHALRLARPGLPTCCGKQCGRVSVPGCVIMRFPQFCFDPALSPRPDIRSTREYRVLVLGKISPVRECTCSRPLTGRSERRVERRVFSPSRDEA